MDAAHPSRRHHHADATQSFEYQHAHVLDQHDTSAHVFHHKAGFGEQYMHRGVQHRSVTPLQTAHLRLTTLEDTLSRMQIGSNGIGTTYLTEGNTTNTTGNRLNTGTFGVNEKVPLVPIDTMRPFTTGTSGTFSFTPLPSPMVPPGTPRFTYTPGRTHKRPPPSHESTSDLPQRSASTFKPETGRSITPPHSLRRTTERSPLPLSQDRSAQSALQWIPTALQDPTLANTFANNAASHYASDLPPPLPLLQSQAHPHSFVSRASSRGITPRRYMSGLQAALETHRNAHITSKSPSRTMTFAGHGHHAHPHHHGEHQLDPLHSSHSSITGTSHVQPKAQGLVVRSGSPMKIVRNDNGHTEVLFDNTLSVSGKMTQRSKSPSRQSDLNASTVTEALAGAVPVPVEDADGMRRTVQRTDIVQRVCGMRNPTLTRLRSGPELMDVATLQARQLRRLEPLHGGTDLTHKYITNGEWGNMNLTGDTLSPSRRIAMPRPLSGQVIPSPSSSFHHASAKHRISPPASPGFAADSQQAYGFTVYSHPAASSARKHTSHYLSYESSNFQDIIQESNTLAHSVGELIAPPLTTDGISLAPTSLGHLMLHRQEGNTSHIQGDDDTPPPLPPAIVHAPSPEQWPGRATMADPGGAAQAKSPITHTQSYHKELQELDTFDTSHAIHTPAQWPRKVLRSKVIASGILDALGITVDRVEHMEKRELLALYQRIPATRRSLALFGDTTSMGIEKESKMNWNKKGATMIQSYIQKQPSLLPTGPSSPHVHAYVTHSAALGAGSPRK